MKKVNRFLRACGSSVYWVKRFLKACGSFVYWGIEDKSLGAAWWFFGYSMGWKKEGIDFW